MAKTNYRYVVTTVDGKTHQSDWTDAGSQTVQEIRKSFVAMYIQDFSKNDILYLMVMNNTVFIPNDKIVSMYVDIEVKK